MIFIFSIPLHAATVASSDENSHHSPQPSIVEANTPLNPVYNTIQSPPGSTVLGVGDWVEDFSATPSNWLQDSGTWRLAEGKSWYTEGRPGYSNVSTYNQNYTDVDFSALLWRYGSSDYDANRIYIRASGSIQSDGHPLNGYQYQYNRNGDFSIWKRINGVVTAVKDWQASSAINPGDAWNALRAVAEGSRLSFYINGQLVWSGTDSSLQSGRVGVGMYRGDTSTGDGFFVDWAKLVVPSSVSTYTLKVAKAGTGSGTVTSNPAGIDCGSDCTENYADGTRVTLTAAPVSGSTFAGWSGAGCSGTGSCTLNMSTAQTVTADFAIASSGSNSAATKLITHYYQSIIERAPDASGLAYWQGLVAQKQAQGADVKEVFRDMADYFFNSAEYIGKRTTDRQFITNLYLTFFQRTPDEAGYTFWLNKLAGGMTRNQAMGGFLNSQEFTAFMEQVLGGGSVSQDELLVLINVDITDKSNVQPYVFVTEEGSIYSPYLNRDGAGAPVSTYGFKYISPDGEMLHSFFDPATGFLTTLYFTDAIGRVKVDVKNYDAATGKGDLVTTYEDGTVDTVADAQLDLVAMPLSIQGVSSVASRLNYAPSDTDGDLENLLDDNEKDIRDYAPQYYRDAVGYASRIGDFFDRFRGRIGRILTRIRNVVWPIGDAAVENITHYPNQPALDDAVQEIESLPAPARETYRTPILDEICGDGVDNNRDGQLDEDCSFAISIRLWDDQCPDDVIGLEIDGANYGNTPEGKARDYNVSNLKPGQHTLKVIAISSAGSRYGCESGGRVSYGLTFLGQSYSGVIMTGTSESYSFTLQ